jgi:N-dimethylarginine dimethylaminohydrolase
MAQKSAVAQNVALLDTRQPPLDRARAKRNVRKPAGSTLPFERLDNSSPSQLEKPAFLMYCPFSYHTGEPNNPWMTDLDDDKRRVNRDRAISQFAQLYHFMSAESLVYLLPAPLDCTLQDLVFTANLGIVLNHIPQRNVVVLSNFTSPPRMGETEIGQRFFEAMGYECIVAPHKFEGEAELKHLHGNIYIGGYGIRSECKTYDWMEREFDMSIVKVREAEKYLYHLDCSIFPITSEDTLVCTELFTKSELAKLAKHTNVIDVSVDAAFSGICNSVRLHNSVLNSSHLHSLKAGTDEYREEIKKNRELEDIAIELGLEVSYFNLSEYHKSGALLSCMVMHLNRRSHAIPLI